MPLCSPIRAPRGPYGKSQTSDALGRQEWGGLLAVSSASAFLFVIFAVWLARALERAPKRLFALHTGPAFAYLSRLFAGSNGKETESTERGGIRCGRVA